jgi:hypothetical protein
MAQTGFTPIQLYSSSTATNVPLAANLATGELAINITDGKLFYKDNAAAVQVIGWKVVPATAGGTGQTSYAVGDLLYANTTTTLAKLADVATGNALISGGIGVAPSWGKIGLTTHVSGVLPIANGGSGQTTAQLAINAFAGAVTSGSYLRGNGTNVVMNTIQVADVPTLNQNTSGTAASTPKLLTTNFTIEESSSNLFFNSGVLTLDASGNFLVNQTSQNGAGKAEISFDRATNWGMQIRNTTGTTQSATYIEFKYGSTATGRIESTGTITTYGTTSDYRLKNTVLPMTGALDRIAALKPVTYKWNSDGSDGEGFIAHELQAVVSDCVTGEKDAIDANGNPVYQGIDTSFLVATLTAAIQEQQVLIETLTQRIIALEAK